MKSSFIIVFCSLLLVGCGEPPNTAPPTPTPESQETMPWDEEYRDLEKKHARERAELLEDQRRRWTEKE